MARRKLQVAGDDNGPDVNVKERSYKGCYGQIISYEMMPQFLKSCFNLNEQHENEDVGRFAACVWGMSGVGKSEIVKDFANAPVTWNGQKYAGYDVRDVPIAQFEEMGDLHGMPSESFLVRNDQDEEAWAFKEALAVWEEQGYKIVPGVQSRTTYAPPDWVPLTPGPAILLLDDWNRASIRVIKGIMQLLQNYGMVSWKLPPGCNIVLTGNPDEQDFLVTSIDSAILTRIKHVTLREDAKEWAIWATRKRLDPRGISFVLRYPEMMIGPERTNPRTLSEFFRTLKQYPEIDDTNREEVQMHGNSLLDAETVSTFIVFCARDMEDVIEPEDILAGGSGIDKRVKKLMDRKEPRIDIMGIICERLYAHMIQPGYEIKPERVQAFQDFVVLEHVPDDIRHSLCRRICKTQDGGKSMQWVYGNDLLREMILGLMR